MAMTNMKDIARCLVDKHGLKVADAERFIALMIDVINEGVQRERQVKIKGLGTFKLTSVSSRESVDVNTGERIVIEGRDKISFTPDNAMKELVNRPFSQFETVVINEGVELEDEFDEQLEESTPVEEKTESVEEKTVEKVDNPHEEPVEAIAVVSELPAETVSVEEDIQENNVQDTVSEPVVSEVPLTQIDNLRFACNDFNLKQGDFKAYYTINPKEEAINTHLVFNFRLADNDKRQSYELGSMLQHTFEMSRLFRQTFHSISESGNSDLEENSALSLRERYLSSELELWHQHPKLTWRDNSTAQHTIAQLFHTFYEDESQIRFHGLQTMQTQWSKTIYDASDDATSTEIAASISCRPREIALSSHEEISNFVLLDALGDRADVEEDAVLSPVTLQVLATVGELERKTFVIHLDVESRVEKSDYVSVLFIEPTSPLSPVCSETSMAEMRKNLTHRFLMVRDHVEHEQREAEFRYQWQETQDALRRGDKLTEEQRFMGMSVVPNVGFNLYWGRRYFNAKRFYEALQHLENAYRVLNVNFEGLNKTAREHFYEVCYFIGFCYAELKLYERAYFYLDIVYPQNSVRYASEYVNLLVNTKDFRALATI